jgi:hypothetical protein
MYKYFVSFAFACLSYLDSISQTNQEREVDSMAVMNWLSKSYSFNKPDTGFISLDEGNGYGNAALSANIKYISFPQRYAKVKGQFTGQKRTEPTRLINTITHNLKGTEAFTIVQEEVSPDKTLYENYISLMTIVDFGNITVCVVGTYPKSKDAALREKFLKAALSVKEE